MLAEANPNTNNLAANLEILSCESNPSKVSALNHRTSLASHLHEGHKLRVVEKK
jgi:hypothetical protein